MESSLPSIPDIIIRNWSASAFLIERSACMMDRALIALPEVRIIHWWDSAFYSLNAALAVRSRNGSGSNTYVRIQNALLVGKRIPHWARRLCDESCSRSSAMSRPSILRTFRTTNGFRTPDTVESEQANVRHNKRILYIQRVHYVKVHLYDKCIP